MTTGSGDRRTWIYTVTVNGPGSTVTVSRGRAGVAHLQYAVDRVRSWRGLPPWAPTSLSGALLASVERQLAGRGGRRTG